VVTESVRRSSDNLKRVCL